MALIVPVTAVIGYALGNGIAPILQKIGADREKRPKPIDFTILFRLMKNKQYLMGVFLQIGGLALGLIALRVFPLFLVQSVLAASIAVTALTERLVLRHHLSAWTYKSILVVLVGLVLLALTAKTGRATPPPADFRLGIELSPIGLALLGLVFTYYKNWLSAFMLALISGLAFGAMAIVGRVIIYPTPFWHLFGHPMFWALIAYGLLGQFLFINALQRASGTVVNTLTSVTTMFAPAITGLLFFNDKIRSGYALPLIIGSVLVVSGSLAITRYHKVLPDKLAL